MTRGVSLSVRCCCLTFKHMERIWICGLYLLTPTMLNTCSFQKYFGEQVSEYHSSACAAVIAHCKEKWKLLLWGGDLIENRKKLTCQLIMDIWRYSSMILIYFLRIHAPGTTWKRALQTQAGRGWGMYAFFLGTLSFVFVVMPLGTKKICPNTFMKISFKILLWISICIQCTLWKQIK